MAGDVGSDHLLGSTEEHNRCVYSLILTLTYPNLNLITPIFQIVACSAAMLNTWSLIVYSVSRQLSSCILARFVTLSRNGSRIQDLHQNTSHHVIFGADNFISCNLFPACSCSLTNAKRGNQLSAPCTYYRHHVELPMSIIGTHQYNWVVPVPWMLLKFHQVHEHLLHCPSKKKKNMQPFTHTNFHNTFDQHH